MNNRQFKNRFLVSEINTCLTRARLCIVSRVPAGNFDTPEQALEAEHLLLRALSFARQLPDNPKHRALRAYIITAREALAHV